jgi:hypothetical protein
LHSRIEAINRPATVNMNTSNQSPSDGRLGSLLREARPVPDLPPRFQENVWRRIERPEATATTPSRIDVFAAWVLKPRFALAAAIALVLAGVLLGSLEGAAQARQTAQERYLSTVAMSVAP